jgi:hypothetical protein
MQHARDLVPGTTSGRVLGASTGSQISVDWTGLWDGAIDTTLQAAGITSDYWWSGTQPNGTRDSWTCASWTTNSMVDSGAEGDDEQTDSNWIRDGTAALCIQNNVILCIAY